MKLDRRSKFMAHAFLIFDTNRQEKNENLIKISGTNEKIRL